MRDFLTFRRMITPIIVQGLFWLTVAALVIIGLFSMIGGDTATLRLQGLALLFFGPLFARVWFEILMVVFRINDTLTDIRRNTAPPGKSGAI